MTQVTLGGKKKKNSPGCMPRTPPRSLHLRRSFWKTVSIYPRSAPAPESRQSVPGDFNVDFSSTTRNANFLLKRNFWRRGELDYLTQKIHRHVSLNIHVIYKCNAKGN